MTCTQRHPSRNLSLPILAAILFLPVAMAAFAMDIFIPFVPFVADELATENHFIQYSLSFFMIVMALGQIFMGPLSDTFGRKPLLIICSVLFAVGSFLCSVSTGLKLFLLGRFMQALGACGGHVISLACARDHFQGKDLQSITSFFVSFNGITQIIAPLLGTTLAFYFGSWRYSFIFLCLLGIISILILSKSLGVKSTKKAYVSLPRKKDIIEIFFHKNFQQWFFVPATIMTGLFTFFALSTHYVQVYLEYDAWFYSYFFAINGFLYMSGSFLSAFNLSASNSSAYVKRNLLILMLLSILLITQPLFSGGAPSIFFICSLCMSFIYGLTIGVSTGLLLESFDSRSGLAASLCTAIQFSLAPILTEISLLMTKDSGFGYGIIIFMLTLISFYKIRT